MQMMVNILRLRWLAWRILPAAIMCYTARGDEVANLQLLRNRCLYYAAGRAPLNASVDTIRHGLWAQSPFSPAINVAASGFSLAALPAAVANGLMTSNAAATVAANAAAQVRWLVTKSAAATNDTEVGRYGYRGVLFRYYTWDDTAGEFYGSAGTISLRDTSLLMFGLLTCANYFGGDVARDYAVARDAIRWHNWFDSDAQQFYDEYYPRLGFLRHCDWYTQETMLICVLAAMSDPQVDALLAWRGWWRNAQTYVSPEPDSQTFTCYASRFGDPFTVFYGQAFLDFSRLGSDADGVDWFQQAQTAYQAHVEFFRKERGYLDALTLGFHAGLDGFDTFAKPNCGGGTPVVQTDATLYTVAGGLDYYTHAPAANPLARSLSTLVADGGLFDWHGWPVETVVATSTPHRVANNYIVGQDISLTAVAIENYLTHRIHNLVLQDTRLCATLNVIFPALLGTALDAPGCTWVCGGATNWFWQTKVNHDGSAAAQSGAVGAGQESWFQTTTNGPASLLFWWKLAAEPNDGLEFYAYTGTQTQMAARIAGAVDWQQVVTFLPTTNAYTLKWRYVKNGNGSPDATAGWVDQVTLLPCPYATNVPQLFFQDNSGLFASWVLNSTGGFQFARILANTGAWKLRGAGDLDGDGVSDLLFQSVTGDTGGWFMNADGSAHDARFWWNTGGWEIRAAGDYDGAGRAQVFFQTAAGNTAYWRLATNGAFQSAVPLGNLGPWKLRGAGDLDGDHKDELFWQNAAGVVAIWYHNPDGSIRGVVAFNTGEWALCGVTDVDGDGVCDLIWQTPDSRTGGWFMQTNGVPREARFWWPTRGWRLKAAGR